MLQQFDERNKVLLVNINGDLIHRDQAGISPFDSAVQGGDAVWEGLRLYEGKIFRLEEHLDRLRRSARALAFAKIPSIEELIAEIRKTLEANQMVDGVHIRLTLTRGIKITSGMDPRLNQSGPTLIVLAEFKSPVYRKDGLTFVTSSIRRFPPDCLDPNIHHNNLIQSILAKIEANAAGADSALMLDRQGFVAEAHGTHIFLVRSGTVLTPTTEACPEGITRQTVLDLCKDHGLSYWEQKLSMTSVYTADEIFCTGTMGEIAAVTRVDGRTVSDGTVGPITKKMSEWYAHETASSGYPILM